MCRQVWEHRGLTTGPSAVQRGLEGSQILGLMSPPPILHSQTTPHPNVSFYRLPEFCYCPCILVPSALAQACLTGFLARCSNFLNSKAERKPHPSSSFKFHWLPEAPRGLSRILRSSTRPEVRGGPPPAHPGPKQGLRGRARRRSPTWLWLQVLAKRTLFPQIGKTGMCSPDPGGFCLLFPPP